MSLEPGRMLSHYRLVEKIGEGGMGVVWKALDTTLNRQVAIKLLPEAVARSPERTGRFEREARLLATLNHPHIGTIHGFERSGDQPFLVMELVPGASLDALLAHGPLPAAETVSLCLQVAEGMEAAHEKGVIHRDLKPANIKLSEAGTAKILDFGLAKALQPESDFDASRSPTITTGGTRAGTIFGTAAYMSPEQARGRPLDRRTDIWAFGCVLFECLTGRPAFGAETVSDVMVRILERQPDWSLLPEATPPAIRRLLERCLRKDPRQRLRDIGDARLVLEEEQQEGPSGSGIFQAGEPDAAPAGPGGPVPGRRSRRVLAAGAALAVGVLIGAGGMRLLPGREEPAHQAAPLHASLALGPGAVLDQTDASLVDISPDGRRVAFTSSAAGQGDRLHIRDLATGRDRTIPGTASAYGPFFSPDGRWLGYFDNGSSSLMKAPVDGGAPVKICDAPFSSRGAVWSPDGRIIYSRSYNQGLDAVPEEGGTPVPLTRLGEGEKSHRLPTLLPDGESVLFVIGTGSLDYWDNALIAAVSLEGGTARVLVRGGTQPRWSPTGHIVYARTGALYAVRYDPISGELGVPFEVLQGLSTDPVQGPGHFALSRNGTLVYAPGDVISRRTAVLAVDRQGREEELDLPPHAYYQVAASPDGTRLVFQVEMANGTLWVYDLSRRTLARLPMSWESELPLWSHDSQWIYFTQIRGDRNGIYRIPADGSGPQELLLETDHPASLDSVSGDGRWLLFCPLDPGTGTDIWMAPLDDPAAAAPFIDGPGDEHHAAVSPDGRWLAFTSDSSGRFQIYVTPFPGGGPRWQVSLDGGTGPLWSRDGSEIIYQAEDRVMAAPVSPGPEFSSGPPVSLFETRDIFDPVPYVRAGDLHPDGRILLFRRQDPEPPGRLDMILNFPGLLRSREPGS